MISFEKEYLAYKMLRIFFAGYDNDTHLVDDETLSDLQEVFGMVNREDRAGVFTHFVKLLLARKVEFDVAQFQVVA